MVPHEKEMALFQMGILVTNSSLEMLHEYIKDHYMPVILTRRLSHDVLEELKASLYSNNLYPNSKELKQRLRRYILGKNAFSQVSFYTFHWRMKGIKCSIRPNLMLFLIKNVPFVLKFDFT